MNTSAIVRFPALTVPETQAAPNGSSSASAADGAEPSDEALLVSIAGGDKEALGQLFRRYGAMVRGVGRRVVRDAFEAEDLLQEVFLLIYRRCKAFDTDKGTSLSWILQLSYRAAITRRRYLSSRHFYNQLDIDSPAGDLRCAHT